MITTEKKIITRFRNTFFGRLFWDKKFLHYTWIGIIISALNVLFLWFLIDVIDTPTVIASIIVTGVTFLSRYILLYFFGAL